MFKLKSRNEFDANLENHALGNQRIYRLRYINYYKTENNDKKFRVMDWPFDLFMLPKGMSRKDAFTVLSYLTDYIEQKLHLESCSYRSVEILNCVLNLERLGFKKLDNKKYDGTDILDLWTVTGRVLLFKESSHYSSYFEWYSENITLEEVQSIYQKIGIKFYDLIINKNS